MHAPVHASRPRSADAPPDTNRYVWPLSGPTDGDTRVTIRARSTFAMDDEADMADYRCAFGPELDVRRIWSSSSACSASVPIRGSCVLLSLLCLCANLLAHACPPLAPCRPRQEHALITPAHHYGDASNYPNRLRCVTMPFSRLIAADMGFDLGPPEPKLFPMGLRISLNAQQVVMHPSTRAQRTKHPPHAHKAMHSSRHAQGSLRQADPTQTQTLLPSPIRSHRACRRR